MNPGTTKIPSANVAFARDGCPTLFQNSTLASTSGSRPNNWQIKHVIGLSDYDHPELNISEVMHEVTGRTETLLPAVLTEVSPLEVFFFFFHSLPGKSTRLPAGARLVFLIVGLFCLNV